MSTLAFRIVAGGAVLCVGLGLLVLFSPISSTPLGAAEAGAAAEPEPAPPEGQEYTGAKRCASCHFEQYMQWSKTPHAKALQLLPAKYAKDPKCLECHTTGFGEPSGFKDAATSAALAGVSCEACHGPGSVHEEVSKPFAQKKTLTPDEEKLLRDSIWKNPPQNVCLGCHTVQKHGPSMTPPELVKKP